MSEKPEQTPATGDADNADDVRNTAADRLQEKSGRTHEGTEELPEEDDSDTQMLRYLNE